MRKIMDKLRQLYWQHYDDFDNAYYSAKVYAIFMVTFVLPMLALYVTALWLVGMF